MTRFDVARTQQPKSTAAYGSLRFGPLRYQLKRTIGMLPTPDNSECSRHGLVKISALELQAWAEGTRTDLGPNDFQDILDASSAFVAAFRDFDERPAPPPWVPEITEQQELDLAAAQERAMDRAMGIT
ncbi:hypothetical protein [Tateyamaria sp.]|uniref:hypothetical protein n=1 Tax=Tateyamaria sp. TaxID=1929288 RepID=UPI003B218C49